MTSKPKRQAKGKATPMRQEKRLHQQGNVEQKGIIIPPMRKYGKTKSIHSS